MDSIGLGIRKNTGNNLHLHQTHAYNIFALVYIPNDFPGQSRDTMLLRDYLVFQQQHFLLAVSGGIDSMVMLDFFNKNTNLANISVCYVNHNFHSSCKRMGNLVAAYCSSNNIPYFCSSIDSSNITSNVEAQLRKKRYSELFKVCKKVKADYVVTAHHSDDQIETILMKILNASSFSSMRGIRSFNNNIFRPMLNVTKNEILDYAKKNNIVYVADPTNDDTAFTRNFLRKKVTQNTNDNSSENDIFQAFQILHLVKG